MNETFFYVVNYVFALSWLELFLVFHVLTIASDLVIGFSVRRLLMAK